MGAPELADGCADSLPSESKSETYLDASLLLFAEDEDELPKDECSEKVEDLALFSDADLMVIADDESELPRNLTAM